MNIWILTIGSSDVQLKTKDNWKRLFGTGRSQLQPERGFSPPNDPIDGRFPVPARVLGVVYSQPQAEQYFDDLVFPLIDNFLSRIKDQPIDKIILVLGDQSIFQPAERRSQNHAYWQDTCTLQPLLEKYLQQKLEESSPDLQFQTLLLRPTSTAEGLDDWNAVLKLVQNEFSSLEFPDNATIYVSHQAGTPAISSAIQFTSLSRFGQRVKFLVSNERDANLTRVLDSSEYLKGIRQREALTLLDRHDYSGVEALVRDYLKENEDTKILLNAAIQWNFAKFDEFANEIQKLSSPEFQALVGEVKERSRRWWWQAYEAAYLGVVRLKQGNTVEAMFHSFRAVEGLLRQWVDECHAEEIKRTKHPKCEENKRWDRNLNTYGEDLYWFLTLKKPVDQTKDIKQNKTLDIFVFGSQIFKRRNDLFHQLKGLQGKDEVFENWRSPNESRWGEQAEKKWQSRVLNCLNFISCQDFQFIDFDQEQMADNAASLIVKIHQKLKQSIAHI